MLRLKIKSSNQAFRLPFFGYVGYIFNKFFDLSKPLTFLLDKTESFFLRNDIRKQTISKPIYITGLARAGTTIVLELLSKHNDLATHQYKNLLMPYLPHWFSHISKNLKIFTNPTERIHKDGIMITSTSPEVVEEVFWGNFFKHIKDEISTDIIDKMVRNPKFERFYSNHIRKLLIVQNRSRYLTKNNYNITRLEYLLNIFPSSKFLLIIRNPVDHIASLIKQTRLFQKIERDVPILLDWMKIVGHQEFGYQNICINVKGTEYIQKIRKLWYNPTTNVEGWAYYWASIYNFIANQLEKNRKLKKATLIVNYDELCENPAEVIDNILKHTELPLENFVKVKDYYINHLHKPTYYTPNFTNQELAYITEITKATTARFGIDIENYL